MAILSNPPLLLYIVMLRPLPPSPLANGLQGSSQKKIKRFGGFEIKA